MPASAPTLLGALRRQLDHAEAHAHDGSWDEAAEALHQAADLTAAWLQPGEHAPDAAAGREIFLRLERLSRQLTTARDEGRLEQRSNGDLLQRLRRSRRSYFAPEAAASRWSSAA